MYGFRRNKYDFIYKFYVISFIFFVFFSVCNASVINEVNILGKVGKIFVPIIVVFFSFLFKIKFSIGKMFILIFFLFFLGSLMFYLNNLNTSFFNDFKGSFLFIVYILYYNLLIKIIFIKKNKNTITYLFKIILSVSLFAIIINFLFAFILHKSMIDVDNIGRIGFGGFYKDRMLFSLLSFGLFVIIFLLYIEERKKIYIILLLFSLFGVISTNTRTAIYSIFLFIFFYYVNYIINSKLNNKYIKLIINLLLFLLFLLLVIYYEYEINFNQLNHITSGRWFIWSLFFKYYFQGYWLNGLFNLNNIILEKNKFLTYYFEQVNYLNFHSSYLEIISGGSILSIFILIILLKRIWNLLSYVYKLILAIILLMGFFEGFLVEPHKIISMIFWFIILYFNKLKETNA